MSGHLFPPFAGSHAAKIILHLARTIEQVKLGFQIESVCAEEFNALLECLSDRWKPLRDVLRGFGFRDSMAFWDALVGGMCARDRSRKAERLPNSAEDVVPLVHRFRERQNSLNVCFATCGSSRERVHGRAGSSGVPLIRG